MGLKGVAAMAILVVGGLWSDVPVHNFWFWSTIYLLVYRNFVASLISGMPEPDDKSTDTYVWIFRSLCAMDRRFSPYRAHKSFWKMFERGGEN